MNLAGERARERRVRVQTEPSACLGGEMQLLDRPDLTLRRLAAQRLGRKGVERHVVGGMHRNELTLQVRRQLGDLDARLAASAGELVAIVLAFGGELEVDAAAVPGRNLDADIAGLRHPPGGGRQRVERCGIAHELREEDRGALHSIPPSTRSYAVF